MSSGTNLPLETLQSPHVTEMTSDLLKHDLTNGAPNVISDDGDGAFLFFFCRGVYSRPAANVCPHNPPETFISHKSSALPALLPISYPI